MKAQSSKRESDKFLGASKTTAQIVRNDIIPSKIPDRKSESPVRTEILQHTNYLNQYTGGSCCGLQQSGKTSQYFESVERETIPDDRSHQNLTTVVRRYLPDESYSISKSRSGSPNRTDQRYSYSTVNSKYEENNAFERLPEIRVLKPPIGLPPNTSGTTFANHKTTNIVMSRQPYPSQIRATYNCNTGHDSQTPKPGNPEYIRRDIHTKENSSNNLTSREGSCLSLDNKFMRAVAEDCESRFMNTAEKQIYREANTARITDSSRTHFPVQHTRSYLFVPSQKMPKYQPVRQAEVSDSSRSIKFQKDFIIQRSAETGKKGFRKSVKKKPFMFLSDTLNEPSCNEGINDCFKKYYQVRPRDLLECNNSSNEKNKEHGS